MCRFVYTRDPPGYTAVRERSTEIQEAITRLSPVEQRQLAHWFEEALEQAWDSQIEADVAAGRLDQLIAGAEADIAAGRVKPLDEVLGNG